MNSTTRTHMSLSRTSLLAVVGLAGFSLACSRPAPGTFKEPTEAVQALSDLIGSGDQAKAEVLFGPGAMDMLQSGDPVADREDADKVKALIAEKVAFDESVPDTRIVLLGNDAWPFSIPLVKDESGKYWRFDSEAGREEIANRRIGANELDTIASLHALVDAQREYATESRDGQPIQYARRVISTDGMHDGLYWPLVEGEPVSPLGDGVAAAAAEGYDITGGEPQPFHGYYYKLLDNQGPAAPGGARSYVDDAGNMTKGYAAVAWPAKHGMSGVMTFLVNHNGIVFQKDLGEDTEAAAKAITSFDPDPTWMPTWDPGDAAAAPAAADPAAPAAAGSG